MELGLMSKFRYTVETVDGRRESGELDIDIAAVRELLEARGLKVVSVVAASEANEGTYDRVDENIVLEALPTDEPIALSSDDVLVEHRPLREGDVVELAQVMQAAAKYRVPLEVTLSALAEEREDPGLARVARQLSDELARGATIDEALAALGDRLPSEMQGVLRAGVESGDLAGTIERFAQQRTAAQRARLRIRSAIAYPLLVLAIMVPLALFFSWFVIPMFGDMYDEFGLELPQLTEFVLKVSSVLPWAILVTAVLGIGLPLVLRLTGGRWLWHRMRGATPMVGKLWTWSGQREFAAMLASFLQLRLPLTSALAYTGASVSDRNLARACADVNERIQRGEPLGRTLSDSIHFDRSLAALAKWGEEHGALTESLNLATSVFDDRIDQQTAFVRRLVPPVTMIVVSSIALMVVLSLMIPLVKLIEGLSG